MTPIGQPVAVGDAVVFYGTVDRDLYLYDIAVPDGTLRWRQPASPSAVVGGTPLTPDVIDHHVAYFRPEPSGHLVARLVVAAPDSAADLLVSPPTVFRSYPHSCADRKDICVTVAGADGVLTSKRFSLDAGGAAATVADAGAPPAGSRYVGEELLDLGQRDPEILAGFSDGQVRWRSPITRYFSAGASTDYGWAFRLYRSAGTDVGSVGRPSERQGNANVVDWSKAQTAAIDAATGLPVWTADGTSFACDRKVVLAHKVADDRSEEWPVRCHYRGTGRYDRTTAAATYDGLDVTLEGFDVPTGKTTWSVPLGAAESFMKEDVNATVVSETEVLVQAATGAVIVDLATGSTRPPVTGERFWCSKGTFFRYRETLYYSDGTSSDAWRGGDLLQPCTAEGSPATALPKQLPPSVGATIGTRTVVATDNAVVAYDRSVKRT